MNKSFTLIEILVVIVVIGTISAFILVGMTSISSSANIAKGKAFANSLRNSLLLNLVSEWKLDIVNSPAANQTPDSWGENTGSLDGTGGLQNRPQIQTSGCVSNNCLKFDGTDDVINITDTDSLKMDNVTVEMWINPSVLNRGSPIRTISTNRYYMAMQDGPVLTWHVRKSDNTGSYQYSYLVSSVSQWYHIVGTYQSFSFQRFYVNGKKEADLSLTWGPVAATNYAWRIGYPDWSASPLYYNGYIDEVRIYKEALQSYQIQQNYFIGINKLYKNNQIAPNEFSQRLADFKFNLVNNE